MSGTEHDPGRRPRRPRRRHGRPAAVALAVVVGLAAPAAAQAGVRDGAWGFERVTPADKAGGNVAAVDTFRASPDGSGLLYTATAPFAGAPVESAPMYVRYLGRRGAAGWTTRATPDGSNVYLRPPGPAPTRASPARCERRRAPGRNRCRSAAGST